MVWDRSSILTKFEIGDRTIVQNVYSGLHEAHISRETDQEKQARDVGDRVRRGWAAYGTRDEIYVSIFKST